MSPTLLYPIFVVLLVVSFPGTIFADAAFDDSLAGKISYNLGVVLGAFIFPFIALTALTWKKDRRYSAGGRGLALLFRAILSAIAAVFILYWYFYIRK